MSMMSRAALNRLSIIRREISLKTINRHYMTSKILRTQKSENEKKEDEFDKPYSYMNSPAADWKAEQTRNPDYERNIPECQGIVISLSMATFMIYFFILREENDIDEIFDRDLSFYFKNVDSKEFDRIMRPHPKL